MAQTQQPQKNNQKMPPNLKRQITTKEKERTMKMQ